MENNLFKKLKEKLKEKLNLQNIRARSIVKKICTGLCTGLITASLLLSTGCGKTPNNNNNSINNSQNNNENNNNKNQNNNNQPDYSNIVNYILANDYYTNLVARAEADPHANNFGRYFAPIPYGFLEEEGYNTQAIKDGQIYANSRSFILDEEPNSLYIAISVETKSATPYYTDYMIKYSLSDDEVEDYKLLNSEKYIEASFLNDAISQTKEPTIISEVRCTVEAHEGLLSSLSNLNTAKQLLKNEAVESIFLKSFDVENDTFEVYLIPRVSNLTSDKAVAIIPLIGGSFYVEANSDNAYCGPYIWKRYKIANNIDTNSGKNAAVFNTGGLITPEYNYNFNED